MNGLRPLARAMLKGFFRDRMALFFAILFPLMFLVLFGGLLGNQGASKPTIVQIGSVSLLDGVPAAERTQIGKALKLTHAHDEKAALTKVRKGDVDGVLTQRDDGTLVLHFSRADPVKSAVVQGTLQGIVQSANVAASGTTPKFRLQTTQVEDQSLKSIQYYTPGLLGWAVAMNAAFGAAANLVVWRRTGLLSRLRLAPVPTSAVVLARVLVTLVIAAMQSAIFIGLGMLLFGLQLTGSWWAFIPLLAVGTLSFLSIGLLAGSVSKSEEGATALANFVVLPMAFLSGSFFPLDGAPKWLTTIADVLPLRHLNTGMLDVMVRGEGVGAIVQPCLFLLAWTVVLTLVATRFFRWEKG